MTWRTADPSGALQVTEPTAAIGGGIDVVFPVLHGPYGEDGTVQGLLELANVPYVGAGVLGSALGMDKAVSKTVFAAHGLPDRSLHHGHRARVGEGAQGHHRPRHQQPALSRVRQASQPRFERRHLDGVTPTASSRRPSARRFDYDRKIVIEAGVPNAREIECAVLGNDEPEASLPGEIVVTHPDGFYSYEAKYLDPSGATPRIPADLPPEMIERVRRLSVDAFRALDLRRHGACRLLPRRPRRCALPERGQHHPRLHRDLDVSEDVGGHWRLVLRASQSTAHARDRASRAEAATAHVTHVSREFRTQNQNAVLRLCILHAHCAHQVCSIARIDRHLTYVGAIDVASGIATSRSFDKYRDFVLDSRKISPIIYIWYEGGWLSPPVVTAEWFVGGWVANPEEKTMAKKAAKGAKKKAAKKR